MHAGSQHKSRSQIPNRAAHASMAAFWSPCEPPFQQRYSFLFSPASQAGQWRKTHDAEMTKECDLPLIDLSRLHCGDEKERTACVAEIGRASSEWGFFQVVNHGIQSELLQAVGREQRKPFGAPFEEKTGQKFLNGSYRWGNPTAISLAQFSWSESFHLPLSVLAGDDHACHEELEPFREVMRKASTAMADLARILAGVLAENLGCRGDLFADSCGEGSCFLRLNRYPPCPFSSDTFGLVPHTDSDFLTILHQDHVGGLHLMKDTRWVSVKPNPEALIVIIGDLFQAWSNDLYKSVEHRVMTNGKVERYSIAYFLCPSYEFTIGSYRKPSRYRNFTFGEFRKQVQEDVKKIGYKVGLSRFLA